MNLYTLTKISKLGEAHPEYGQTYWGAAQETQLPVMFNSKSSYIAEGQKIAAESYERKQGKKSEYLRLKGIKLVGSGSQADGAHPPQQSIKADSAPAAALSVGHFNLLMKELRDIKADVKKLVGDEVTDTDVDKPLTIDDFGGEDMPSDFLK